MELDLKSDKLSLVRPVFRRRMTKEETAEVIVPDALPDILRILDAGGTAYLRSKDSDAGSVTVAGVMELTVLYVPESGRGVKRVNASLPFSVSAEGGEIAPDSLIIASLRLTGADARTVNPRKLVVRGEAECDVSVYNADAVYGTAPRERDNVYFRSETLHARVPVSVNEKSFVFSDEVSLPAGSDPVGELLGWSTQIEAESAKGVGARAVVKGSARTSVLYESRDGRLCRAAFDTPFSQVVETDAVGEAADFRIIIALTGVYVQLSAMNSGETDAFTLEIHAVAQCVAGQDVELSSVTDAYSTKYALSFSNCCCVVPELRGAETCSENLTLSIPVPEGCSSVRSVSSALYGIRLNRAGEGVEASVSAAVTMVYEDPSGQLLSVSKRGELTRPMHDIPADAVLDAAISGEAAVFQADGAVEVRLPLSLSVTRPAERTVERLESVEIDEDAPIDLAKLPSVVITRAFPEKSLWELAKAHLSTVELIRETNSLEEGREPEPGQVLLIPRCG